jgi:hypothetical protein
MPGGTPFLGQSTAKSQIIDHAPDNDSQALRIMGLPVFAPDFKHDHTRIEYIVPTGNAVTVTVLNPINTENRTLYYLTLDNSNNSSISKIFNFSSAYIFLDDPTNVNNQYIVGPGNKQIWFGAFVNGKLYLRVSSESTN